MTLDDASTVPKSPVLKKPPVLKQRLGQQRHRSHKRFAALLVAVLVVVVVFQYGVLGPARHVGLVPTAEPFTELFFVHPTSLPTTTSTTTALKLSFVIANHEGATRTYHWSATFVAGAVRERLVSGATTLSAGRSRSILTRVTPSTAGTGLLEVDLASPAQGIDFHLSVVAPRPIGPGSHHL